MQKLYFGILTHLKEIGHANSIIIQTINSLGHKAIIIDPRLVIIDQNGNFLKVEKDKMLPLNFDIVISRAEICEISNKFDPKITKSYWNFLQACKLKQITTINGNPFLLEVCQDKFFCHLILKDILDKYQVYNPCTIFFASKRSFHKASSFLKYPLVIKDNFGALGKGIFLIKNPYQLLKIINEKKISFPFITQEFIKKVKNEKGEFRAIRVLVYRNPRTEKPQVICSFWQNSRNFITNVALGGYMTLRRQDPQLDLCSMEILEKVDADMLAVDYVLTSSGRKYFLEINYAPGTSPTTLKVKNDIWEKVVSLALQRYYRNKTLNRQQTKAKHQL